MVKITKNKYIFWGLLLMCSALLVVAWFSSLNYHVFVGDDLLWVKTYYLKMPSEGFWTNVFTIGNEAGKFRPFPTALILLATGICQDSFDCFVWIDLLMITINAFLASIIAYKMTSGWMPSAVIASFVIILSRFSYYAALQVLGIMENLAMTLVLLLTLGFVHFMRSANIKWIVVNIVLFLLILFTHERFIVLVVPVAFALFARRREIGKSRFITLWFVLIFALSGYFLLREYVFHSRFLTGAGDTSITETFSISQVALFIGYGILNLFGFNAGPDYFSGQYFLDAGLGGILVGLFLFGVLATLLYLFFQQQIYKKVDIEFGLITVLILMVGGMLLASSITFRQEYRWLYAPFAVFVLLICYLLGRLENNRLKNVLTILVAVSFVAVDIFYRPFMHNLYFIRGAQVASTLKSEILDKYSPAELEQKEVFLLTGNDIAEKWVFADGYFFGIHGWISKTNMHFVKNIDEIVIDNLVRDSILIASVSGAWVSDVTQETLLEIEGK